MQGITDVCLEEILTSYALEEAGNGEDALLEYCLNAQTKYGGEVGDCQNQHGEGKTCERRFPEMGKVIRIHGKSSDIHRTAVTLEIAKLMKLGTFIENSNGWVQCFVLVVVHGAVEPLRPMAHPLGFTDEPLGRDDGGDHHGGGEERQKSP